MQIQPQNLFSFHHLGHDLSKAYHTAEHYAPEVYKDAKIAGHYAGQAAPVIAAIAGDKYGAYAQQAGQYADAAPSLGLQDLHFSFHHLGHSIGKAAHAVEHAAPTIYKDAKIAGHYAGQAAPVIAAVAGDQYGGYAQQAGMYADAAPSLGLQDLHFSFHHLGHSIGKAAHAVEHAAPTIYKDAKIAGHYAGQAAPVIAAVAGDQYGAYAQQAGMYADAAPSLGLQDLHFSFKHMGHDLKKAAHAVEHVAPIVYKDAKIAGHLAGVAGHAAEMAAPVIGIIGGPEAGAAVGAAGAAGMTAGQIADHMPLQNLQNADLQDLKFSWHKLGKSIGHGFHNAEHFAGKVGHEAIHDAAIAGKLAVKAAPVIYKDAKIAGQMAGKLAPVIGALAGEDYGKYAQTAGAISGNMPLQNLNTNIYLI